LSTYNDKEITIASCTPCPNGECGLVEVWDASGIGWAIKGFHQQAKAWAVALFTLLQCTQSI
jgi:hypothetical protein